MCIIVLKVWKKLILLFVKLYFGVCVRDFKSTKLILGLFWYPLPLVLPGIDPCLPATLPPCLEEAL